MPIKNQNNARGFSLAEVLIAMGIALLLLGGAVTLFKQASDTSQLGLARIDIQQNARGALAIMTRDLSQASIGIPQSGIALPNGAGSTLALYACSAIQCYVTGNTYPNNIMSPVSPATDKGANATDAVIVAYLDNTWPVNNKPLTALAVDGSSITVDTGTYDSSGAAAAAPAGRDYADAVLGTRVGDVIMIFNQHGNAVATVTKVGANGAITLANGDPLNLNQTAAGAGNVASLKNPNTNVYPSTSASRLNVVTYFIQMLAGPDGVLGTADDVPTLMRQVNAQNAIPIVENVTDLQITYDTFDDSTQVYSAAVAGNLVTNSSSIRKVSIRITLKSQNPTPAGGFQTLTVETAVSPRDLSFKDRYN